MLDVLFFQGAAVVVDGDDVLIDSCTAVLVRSGRWLEWARREGVRDCRAVFGRESVTPCTS